MIQAMNLRCLWLALAAVTLSGAVARAEVVTVLSRNETQVGQPVMLVYRFIDTEQPADMPQPEIMVDGLQIRFQGASRQNNFSFSFGGGGAQNRSESVIEFTYLVIPQRPGDFTIPGFEVRVGNRTIRTKGANLKVFGARGYASPPPAARAVPQTILPPGPGQSLPPPQPSNPPDGREGEAYFGEILMSSKPVYVGEVVPVDIRFYFRGDVPISDLQQPVFAGDGFTAVPLGEPQQDEQVMGNVPYRVFTFRSAVTAVKSGEIEIPPVTMAGRVLVSAVPPGFDAFFDQFFRNFPGVGRPEQVEVSTRGRTLKVLPLPREGRPADFSGAVGQFSLEASAEPRSAGPGEPVTLSLQVSGRGNFDTMSPPTLTETDGWRTYAPKEKFQPDDTVGSAGTKTFEFKIVARSNQTATPGAEFSYFDPRKKEYVTLRAAPQPVDAAGRETEEAGENSSTAVASPASTDAGSPHSHTPSADIAAPAAALAKINGSSFTPSLSAPWFRWANAVMLALAIFVLPLILWRRRFRAKRARVSELERVLRQAKSALQKSSDRTEFYNAAAHLVQTRLELLNGSANPVSDAAAALQQQVADPLERRALQSVLARRDEVKYGGGPGGALDDDERRRVVALLEKFADAE
jgi:hypothetical protein